MNPEEWILSKKLRFEYFGAAGICASLLAAAVIVAGERTVSLRLLAPAAALLLSLCMLIVKRDRTKELIGFIGYLAVGVVGIAVPFIFSPTLSALSWMAALLYMCPLLVGIRPALAAIILGAADVASVCVVIVNAKVFLVDTFDLIMAAVAMIVCSVIAITARKGQESDNRRHARTIELLEDSNEELEAGTMTDPLTGLYNKGYFEMVLPKMIAGHEQFGLPLTAIFVDIDHFKNINDTYGHDMGDKALIALANKLQKFFRKEEIIRFGGEEFLILLSVDAFTALKRIDSARQAVEDMETDGIRYTISAGVAEYKDGMADQDLVKAADTQMYRAKTTGRNKVCM